MSNRTLVILATLAGAALALVALLGAVAKGFSAPSWCLPAAVLALAVALIVFVFAPAPRP